MVIDTDILIDHFHGNPAATAFIENMLLAGQPLAISIAAVAEILAGCAPVKKKILKPCYLFSASTPPMNL
jgi:predicted nucleic acid-binding protein